MYDGIPFLGKTMYDYMCKNMYECVFVNRKIISSRVGGFLHFIYYYIFCFYNDGKVLLYTHKTPV